MVQDGLIFVTWLLPGFLSSLFLAVSHPPSGLLFHQALLHGGLGVATLNTGSYKCFKTQCGQGSGITESHSFLHSIG